MVSSRNEVEGSRSSTHQHRPAGVGRHRSRASVACNNCRARKVKCDAQKKGPGKSCTPCQSADVQCIVSNHDDRRRFGARDQLALLQGRLHSLEAMMQQNLRQTSTSDTTSNLTYTTDAIQDQIHQDLPSPTCHSAANSRTSSNPPAATTEQHFAVSPDRSQAETSRPANSPTQPPRVSSPSVSGLQPPSPQQTELRSESSHETPATEYQLMNTIPDDILHSSSLTSTLDGMGMDNPTKIHSADHTASGGFEQGDHRPAPRPLMDPLTLTPPADDQSQRLEVDANSGELRFYGPTTQLHLHSPAEEASMMETEDQVDLEISGKLDSMQLRKSLLNIGWSYYALQASVVDETAFMTHRELATRSQFYSCFLEYAMLACASRVSTTVAVRGLGLEYADRAKKEIPFELENPTLASLQGFLLLSDFEATRGRDRLGWTYTGIACRLVHDLGLHEDCGPLVDKGHLSPLNAERRRALFQGAFVYDSLWSLYLGRPRTICLPPLGAAQYSLYALQNPVLHAWFSLSILIAEATDILNASSILGDDATEQLRQLDLRIQQSCDSLPPEMALHTHAMAELDAAAYGWHMQFCGIRIVIHRSLIKTWFHRQAQGQPLLDPNCNVDTTRSIIYESATRITQLTSAYRQLFGIEKMITVMLDNIYVAAVALINHVLVLHQRGLPVDNEPRRIRLLANTLEQVQKHFPIAFRMRCTLTRMLQGTPWSSLLAPVPLPDMPPPPPNIQDTIMGPPANSWGTIEALIGNSVPDISTSWSTLFDGRDQPWFPEPQLQHP